MKNYFAKLKERDENAIKKLYDDYVRLIYHIAYSYTKNKEDSEDITSEVFLKIVKSIDNYTDEGKLKEWICQIARNKSINYVTRNKHKDVIKDGEIVSLKSSNDNSHRSMLELFEEHLDDDTTSIMILRFIYDYKFKDIAMFLSMTIGKVQGLYYDGIEKLAVTEEWYFASAIIEFSLLIRDSSYKFNASCKNILERLAVNCKNLLEKDQLKEEFYQLVKKAYQCNLITEPVSEDVLITIIYDAGIKYILCEKGMTINSSKILKYTFGKNNGLFDSTTNELIRYAVFADMACTKPLEEFTLVEDVTIFLKPIN